MKIVLQRVNSARVEVDGKIVGSIAKGYVAYLGIGTCDTKETADKLVDKIVRLRIFKDENGKTNLSAGDVGGEIIVISQFTLMADISSNRPNFSSGAKPEMAKELYEYFVEYCRSKFVKIATGQFGAYMQVFSDGDGPFTLVLEG